MTFTAAPTFVPIVGEPRWLADYLGRPGVIRHGHFRLLSGLHAEQFLAFSEIARDAEAVRSIAADLAAVCAPWQPSLVLAPSTAGVALAAQLARTLEEPLMLAALDDRGRATGILGDADIEGARVLLVNDVITTGQGLLALRDAAAAAGGLTIGAACFANRGDVDVAELIEVPVCYSARLNLRAVPAEQCEVCARTGEEPEHAIDIN